MFVNFKPGILLKLFLLSIFFLPQTIRCASELAMALLRKHATPFESLESRCGRIVAESLKNDSEGGIAKDFMCLPIPAKKFPMIHYIDDVLKREIGWRCYSAPRDNRIKIPKADPSSILWAFYVPNDYVPDCKVTSVVFSEDYKRCFWGAQDGSIYVAGSKKMFFIGKIEPIILDELTAVLSVIQFLACSPDGSQIVSLSPYLQTIWLGYTEHLLQLDLEDLSMLFHAMKNVQEKQRPHAIHFSNEKWAKLFSQYGYLRNEKLFKQTVRAFAYYSRCAIS